MTRSCYVISAWGGRRRNDQNPLLEQDGALYLREHIRRVFAYSKDIDLVLVASPRGEGFYPGYEDYIAELEAVGDTMPIRTEVLRRDNIGFSYGSFCEAYEKHRTRFDYYFFAEDDYYPARAGFDRTLIDMISARPKCGFLCGLVWNLMDNVPPHAGIFLGILRAEALEKVLLRNGSFPKLWKGYGDVEIHGQIGMSRAIIQDGYELEDWTDRFSSPFWRESGVQICGDPKLPPLFIPAQARVEDLLP